MHASVSPNWTRSLDISEARSRLHRRRFADGLTLKHYLFFELYGMISTSFQIFANFLKFRTLFFQISARFRQISRQGAEFAKCCSISSLVFMALLLRLLFMLITFRRYLLQSRKKPKNCTLIFCKCLNRNIAPFPKFGPPPFPYSVAPSSLPSGPECPALLSDGTFKLSTFQRRCFPKVAGNVL